MSFSDHTIIGTPISPKHSHTEVHATEPQKTNSGGFHFDADNIFASAEALFSLADTRAIAEFAPTDIMGSSGLSAHPLLPQSVSDFISAAGAALAGQQTKVAELAHYGTAAANHLTALAASVSASEQSTARSFDTLR